MSLYDKLKNYVEENLTPPDSDIYHYTKPVSGKKIIESGVLWLTSHEDLNKKNNREFKVSLEIINDKIKNTSIRNKTPLFNDYFLIRFKGYIASFCEEDSYEHARNAYGTFCLGFKDSYLQKYLSDNLDVMLVRVIYNRKEQERIISEMIQLHEEYPNSNDHKLNDLMVWLSIITPFLKEERDHRDNECRIITAHNMDVNDPTKVVGKHCATEIIFNESDIILPQNL